jgi:protein subunit release factor A
MIEPKDIRVDLYSTAAPTGQREGILLLSHMPTRKVVRVEWSERSHDSLLQVKEKAMAQLTKLVEEVDMSDDKDDKVKQDEKDDTRKEKRK